MTRSASRFAKYRPPRSLVVRLVAEHGVGGGQHGGGDRHDGLLRAALPFEAPKLRLQIASVRRKTRKLLILRGVTVYF